MYSALKQNTKTCPTQCSRLKLYLIWLVLWEVTGSNLVPYTKKSTQFRGFFSVSQSHSKSSRRSTIVYQASKSSLHRFHFILAFSNLKTEPATAFSNKLQINKFIPPLQHQQKHSSKICVFFCYLATTFFGIVAICRKFTTKVFQTWDNKLLRIIGVT